MNFSFYDRLRSMKFAFKGILTMLRHEHNAWIHALATIVVSCAGFYFQLTIQEWLWIVVAVVFVWLAETLNTALEFLADVAVPDFHPMIEKAKDVSAGAVLIACIGAVIIAILIFGPYIISNFGY